MFGKVYVLREEIAAPNYVKATDVKFKIDNTGNVQKVSMVDKIVEMSKQDVFGNELVGASMKVADKNNNIVDSWVSDIIPHKIQNLVEGETYTLCEEIAVDGYVKATNMTFTVTYEKDNQKIVMVDKMVLISKVDLVTGEELEGAELIITDENDTIIDQWISTKEKHQVSRT